MPKMLSKIGFICGSKAWGGLEINQLKNAIWLREFGIEVVILCKLNAPIKEKAFQNQIPILILSEHRRYKYFQAGIKFAKIISQNNFTHIIARDSKDLNICSIAKTFSKKNFHLSYFMEMQLGVSKRNFLHTARYKKIDVWFCPLNYLKAQVLKFTRFPETKIHVLPSALDLNKKSYSKSEGRKILNLPNDLFICGLVGRIDPYKGQIDVIKAIHEINHEKIVLCIIGSPTINESESYFNEIKEYIKKFNLDNKIFFIPWQENVYQLYNSFDVTIMASKSETFGMVTIESLANGIPVIGTNRGGTPEILEFGKYGYLYDYKNHLSLSLLIKKMFEKQTFNSKDLINYSKKYDFINIIPQILKKII
jgi:glycosyltransferase involved in cell wall biosynthesis